MNLLEKKVCTLINVHLTKNTKLYNLTMQAMEKYKSKFHFVLLCTNKRAFVILIPRIKNIVK